MSNVNESLLYGVSDILQVVLHIVGTGYKSTEVRKVKLGPWNIALNIQVKSDVLTKEVASFWVRLNGDLWLYIVSSNNGNSIKCIVFSGSAAKLNKGMLATSCENGILKESLAKVKAAGGMAYTYKNSEWVPCEIDI